jgi:hypothetical protein
VLRILAANSLDHQADIDTTRIYDQRKSRSEAARSRQMRREAFVYLEHGHLVFAEDPPELVIGHDFAAVLWVLQVVRTDVLPDFAHTWPRGSGPEPITAASSSDSCSGCRAFTLTSLVFSPAFWSASISSRVCCVAAHRSAMPAPKGLRANYSDPQCCKPGAQSNPSFGRKFAED